MRSFLRPGKGMVFLALLFSGFLFYGRALFFPFVHDDTVFIVANPSLGRWDNIGAVFLRPALDAGVLTTAYYRPLLEVVYRLQHTLFGLSSGAFHGTNIVLHVLNGFGVFCLAMRLRAGRPAALFGAGLFLLHPVQSQAVACVSGISNLVVTGLLLLAFHAVLLRRQGAAFTAFLAAFLAKETALVFPALVWGRDILFRERRQGRAALFAVLAGALVLVRFWLMPPVDGGLLGPAEELWLRLKSIPGTLLMDLRLMVWPADLHYYRSVDMLRPALAPALALGGILWLSGMALRGAPARIRQLVLFGAGWWVLALLPSLNIVPLINEYSLMQAAEHFLYLPMVGVCAAGAAALRGVFRGPSRRVALGAAGLVLLAAGMMTAVQIGQWRSEVALFERTVRFEPGLGRAWLLLGRAYALAGRPADAASAQTRGITVMERHESAAAGSPAAEVYRRILKTARQDRGISRLLTGDLPGAEADFRAGLALRLERPWSRDIRQTDSRSALNAGVLSLVRGDRKEALRLFRRAVQLDGDNPQALNSLAVFLGERGDTAAARMLLGRALRLAPDLAPVRKNLKRFSSR